MAPDGLEPPAGLETRRLEIPVGEIRCRVEVVERARATDPEAVTIVLACHEAFALTRACLDAIERFTDTPHEVWVVDNASSPATVERLRRETKANLILNHVAPWKRGTLLGALLPWYRRSGGGSIANGVALELAATLVRTRWMFVMHNDAMPCRRGWLAFMKSRLSDRVRGVAVNQDRLRVGAMHQSGFLFDFSLFRPLGMSFLPNLPAYDAGDLVTIRLREAGYEVAICDNVANNPALRDRLPDGHWLKPLPCDIAFDGSGEIFYLHLGRGTLRYSKPGSRQGRQLALEEWLRLVRDHVFREAAA